MGNKEEERFEGNKKEGGKQKQGMRKCIYTFTYMYIYVNTNT